MLLLNYVSQNLTLLQNLTLVFPAFSIVQVNFSQGVAAGEAAVQLMHQSADSGEETTVTDDQVDADEEVAMAVAQEEEKDLMEDQQMSDDNEQQRPVRSPSLVRLGVHPLIGAPPDIRRSVMDAIGDQPVGRTKKLWDIDILATLLKKGLVCPQVPFHVQRRNASFPACLYP